MTDVVRFSRIGPERARSRRRFLGLLVFLTSVMAAVSGCASSDPSRPGTPAARAGTPGHVFIINLENKGYDRVWGSGSPAPYLSGTLRSQGVLLSNYYGISHNSLPNYLAQISGQLHNDSTKQDCRTYTPFTSTGVDAQGRLQGDGCVFPVDVPTLSGQLSGAGKTWRGYMEDMSSPCQHPDLGAADAHVAAAAGDQYGTRHNPFMYFRSITSSPDCAKNVVNYSALQQDLRSVGTTRNLSYITPDLCHDAHDSPCVDGTAGGLGTADAWLKSQVPAILSSPAFRQDGMLVITFDEADGGAVGPSSGVTGGTEGGKVGALVISPFSPSGATSVPPLQPLQSPGQPGGLLRPPPPGRRRRIRRQHLRCRRIPVRRLGPSPRRGRPRCGQQRRGLQNRIGCPSFGACSFTLGSAVVPLIRP